LISTELAQRPTRALIHVLIGGIQPHTGWWAPVVKHIYNEMGAGGTGNEVHCSRQHPTKNPNRSRGECCKRREAPPASPLAPAHARHREAVVYTRRTPLLPLHRLLLHQNPTGLRIRLPLFSFLLSSSLSLSSCVLEHVINVKV
jgi:hypothetical protein